MKKKLKPFSRDRSDANVDRLIHLFILYSRLISSHVPPDQLIANYFREQPKMPASERTFVAREIYRLLRQRIRLLHCAQWSGQSQVAWEWLPGESRLLDMTPVEETALALLRWHLEDERQSSEKSITMLTHLIDRIRYIAGPPGSSIPDNPERWLASYARHFVADPELSKAPEDIRWAARYSMPADIIKRWRQRFGDVETIELLTALGKEPPLDIRANLLKGSRDLCRQGFEEIGFSATNTPLSPDGLRFGERVNLFQTYLFEDGWFEVQEEASQLVSLALDPKPNWRILDACAGAGGKTLHLAAIMKNRGDIYSHDLAPVRLESQKKRLRRADVHNVRLLPPGEASKNAPYDAVLIDAPCLGLGTLRRNPDFGWRGLISQRLREVTALQQQCLNSYAPLVKPGGILVYATCSFEPEETSEMLKNHPIISQDFRPDSLEKPLSRYHLHQLVSADEHTLTLLPHRHGTDGFFLARFRRQS